MDHFQQVLKLAFTAHNAGRQEEAEALCRVLVELNRPDAQLYFLLGMVLHKTRRDIEAVSWLRRAAELQPNSANILSGLGYACQGAGQAAEALKYFIRATELAPSVGDFFYSVGIAQFNLGQLEAALAAFQNAVKLNPRDSASWNNLGKLYKQFNRLDESLAAYDRALEAAPDFELAKHGRAISLLTAGRWAEGFREYESRWSKLHPRVYPRPRWQGEPISSRTLFLHAEQGFGDAIHFARFMPLARQHAARVILECRPELKSLLVFSQVADEVVAVGEPLPPFDYFNSFISLPGLLGISLENLPAKVPYLKAPPGPDLPAAHPGRLKVGIVWAGSSAHRDDVSRSMSLESFLPVLQIPGACFFSFQKVIAPADEPLFRRLPGMVDLAPQLTDFLATAALLNQMDLVISVDTSVAHLAGALAKPVWNLIQFDADWRWLLDREDTPWYPTMRLFRQPQRGQWPPVVARVASELNGLLTGRAGAAKG